MTEWFSTEEKAPPTEDCGVESINVLVALRDSDNVVIAFMEDLSVKDSWTDGGRLCNFDVTHWSLLPDSPTKLGK